MVLKLSSIDLHLRAIKILGRRFHAILDTEPATQLHHCRPDSRAHLYFRFAPPSTCTCGRSYARPQRGDKGAAHAAFVQLSERIHHAVRHSRLDLCLHSPFHVAYPNYPPPCGFVTFCALGSGVVDDEASFLGASLGFLECSLGNYIPSFVGYLPSASLNLRRNPGLVSKISLNTTVLTTMVFRQFILI